MPSFPVTATDTGLTLTESLARVAGRSLTSTGLTVSGTVAAAPTRLLADTGLTVTDAITPGLHVVVLADDGLQNGPLGAPILDNFNRANETPLSDGGKWSHSGPTTNTVNLISNAAVPNGSPSQMDWNGNGSLGDCEVYATFKTLPTTGGAVGVVLHQLVGFTGEDAYAAVLNGSGTTVSAWILAGDGSVIPLATYTLPAAAQVGDKIGLRWKGGTLTTWYWTPARGWQILGTFTNATAFTSGYIGIRFQSSLSSGSLDDFAGGAPTAGVIDTLAFLKLNGRLLVDTGVTITDSLRAARHLIDMGLAVTEALQKTVTKPLADVGLTLTESLGRVLLVDIGLVLTDVLLRSRPVALTATGATITDTLGKTARKVVADTGITSPFSDSLVARKNGHNTGISLTDRGVTIVGSLARNVALFRAFTDTGLAFTEGVHVLVNGVPSGSCSTDFARFLNDLAASPEYTDWCTANPTDCSTWQTYRDRILAGGTPSPPTMATAFGTALVAAGILALDGIVVCRRTRPPGAAITAAFTVDVTGLTVYFTNNSTAGPSGIIASWKWGFGDGDTDTTNWNSSHTYAAPGTYRVTLTVTGDGSDGSDSATHLVTVFIPSTAGIHIDAVLV